MNVNDIIQCDRTTQIYPAPTDDGIGVDTAYWDPEVGTSPISFDIKLTPDQMREAAGWLLHMAGPTLDPEPEPEPDPVVRRPAAANVFRRPVPTLAGGWLIATSTRDGIYLSQDARTHPTETHPLTPEQALSLADALTTAARHQTLTLPHTPKDPS